jgi:hypothetical protein
LLEGSDHIIFCPPWLLFLVLDAFQRGRRHQVRM